MCPNMAVYWSKKLILSDITNVQQEDCQIHVGNSFRSPSVKVTHDMKIAAYVSQEGTGSTYNPTFSAIYSLFITIN